MIHTTVDAAANQETLSEFPLVDVWYRVRVSPREPNGFARDGFARLCRAMLHDENEVRCWRFVPDGEEEILVRAEQITPLECVR